jgi:hypothetical protein
MFSGFLIAIEVRFLKKPSVVWRTPEERSAARRLGGAPRDSALLNSPTAQSPTENFEQFILSHL